MIRIYFEVAIDCHWLPYMVTIKMEKRIRLYIFFFCCLNILFFSLRGSEIYFCWVSCFCFCKIAVFIIENAPLILKTFNNKTDIYFFVIRKLLFFPYVLLFTDSSQFKLYLPPQISFIDLFAPLSCQS